MSDGRLTVCATPIGNLGDVSERLRETLIEADVIYAEDTRRTAKLLSHIGAKAPLRSLFSGNERARTKALLEDVKDGKRVALVSDAGMPSVSDPGADAVAAVRAAGFLTTVVPGPSAVTSAVALAGFGGSRFVFEGFLPRKGKERRARLASFESEVRVVVLFASPRRLANDLTDLAEALGGERQVAVIKEMTKLHEAVWVGTLSDGATHWSGEQKGEFTIVIGPGSPPPPSLDDAVDRAERLVGDGVSPSDAARQTADETGVSRRDIYQRLID